MQTRDFSTALLKLGGVWLVVQAMIALGKLLPAFFLDEVNSEWIVMNILSQSFVPLIAGGFLLIAGAHISDRFIPKSKGESAAGHSECFEVIGITVLGLFLLFGVISDIVFHLAYIDLISQELNYGASYRETFSEMALSNPDKRAAIIATGAEFFVVMWFVLGARGIVSILKILRS